MSIGMFTYRENLERRDRMSDKLERLQRKTRPSERELEWMPGSRRCATSKLAGVAVIWYIG